MPADARLLQHTVRAHWSVETTVHWALDVTFREAAARFPTGDSAEHVAALRHVALTLLTLHPTQLTLTRKRSKAALADRFRLELMSQV